MKVAVTGASGFVGQHLVKRLLDDNHEVTALIRSGRLEESLSRRVNEYYGSVEDTASMVAAFGGQEAVIHLVGLIAETKTKTFEKTVAQGTANLVDACRAAGIRKIVFLSALGTAPNAQTKYHRTKYAAEQVISKSGLDFTILRASVIFGPGDGFISLLSRLISKMPFTPVIGDGRYQLQPIFIDDLTRSMAGALAAKEASGEIIDLAGPEKLEYLEILDILKSVMGKRKMNFFVPVALMRPMAFLLEKLMKPAPLTRDQLVMMEMGNTGDITKMRELLGIEPTSLENGLRTYMR